MLVKEYRPTFIDVDMPLRETRVASVTDALQIEWVKERGGSIAVNDEFIKTSDGWVIATIRDEPLLH